MFQNLVQLLSKKSSGRVFISYRRDDTQWFAGRLADSLTVHFGDKRVFRDIEDIKGGADFGKVIQSTLTKTDATIVLIGEKWLDITDTSGNRRIDLPDDWVGQEIATALESGTPVYPVLVEDTPMPRSAELPERLQPLLKYNAITINDNRWDSDVDRLARVIGLDIPSQTERKLNGLNLLISVSLAFTLLASFAALFYNLACNLAVTNPLPDWFPISRCDPPKQVNIDGSSAPWPVSLAVSGIAYLAITPCSALLFVFSNLVERTKRKWFLAAAWAGGIGAASAFLLLKPIPIPYEPIAMLSMASLITLVMLALMCLSGFRPK